MGQKSLNIGIIGCGWIAQHAHIPAFNNIENVKVSSVFDIDIERAARLAELYDIKGIYNDLNKFFKSGIDAVIVATPNFTHVGYSLQALRHGLHVICEKPIAMYSDEVRKIIDTAEKAGLVFLPGFVNRFRYDVMKVRELLQSNKIGEIVSIEAGWIRRSGIPRPGTWFTNKELSGGGVLIDLGSHIVDICLMLFGDKMALSQELSTLRQDKRAKQLNANWFTENYSNNLQIDVEDTALANIQMEGNKKLDIKLSWASDIKGDCTFFIINGTKGSIKLKTLFGFSNDRLWKDDSLIIEDDTSGIHVIPLDEVTNNTRDAFHGMAKYFVDVVRGGEASLLAGRDGLKTVELIEKLYKNENRIDNETINTSLEGVEVE